MFCGQTTLMTRDQALKMMEHLEFYGRFCIEHLLFIYKMCWVEERNTSPEISLIIAFLFCGWNSTVENSIKDFASTSWECHVRFAAANRFGIFFGLFSPTWSWLSMGNLPEISRFISTSGCFFFFFPAIQSGHVSKMMIFGFLKMGRKGRESVTASSD